LSLVVKIRSEYRLSGSAIFLRQGSRREFLQQTCFPFSVIGIKDFNLFYGVPGQKGSDEAVEVGKYPRSCSKGD
jgi:hypothetical protein